MILGCGFAAGDDDHVVHPRPGRLDRPSRLLLSAAQKAMPAPPGDSGVFVATEHGAFAANAEHWGHVLASGLSAVSPLIFPATVPSAPAGEVAIALPAMGPNVTLCGFSSARQIVRMARRALRDGECDGAYVAVVTALRWLVRTGSPCQ